MSVSPSIEADRVAQELVPSGHNRRALWYVMAPIIATLLFGFVPWQQTATGSGRVIAFAPQDRAQPVKASIEGRLVKWNVQEGQAVSLGEVVAELEDNDPQLSKRLDEERDAIEKRVKAAQERVSSIEDRIRSLQSAQKAALTAADSRVAMAEQRRAAAVQAERAAQAAERVTRLNLERQRKLLAQGLASQRGLELAELESARAQTDVERARAQSIGAASDISAAQADRAKANGDASAAIGDAQATRASALADVSAGTAELARTEVRVSRQKSQQIVATTNGVVQKVLVRAVGEWVKAGDTLAVLVPSTPNRVVETWVDGNDINLIRPGQIVRLQFEGWPAVQFSGWPSASVGTYEGVVSFVDPSDESKGQFRVVVVSRGQWPPPAMLRQGTRVNTWILLGRVRLGYELWRQFNGFPPEWTGKDASEKAKESGQK